MHAWWRMPWVLKQYSFILTQECFPHYGIGLADVRAIYEEAVEGKLSDELISSLDERYAKIAEKAKKDVQDQEIQDESIFIQKRVHVRYDGTDSAIVVDAGNSDVVRRQFEESHKQRFGLHHA